MLSAAIVSQSEQWCGKPGKVREWKVSGIEKASNAVSCFSLYITFHSWSTSEARIYDLLQLCILLWSDNWLEKLMNLICVDQLSACIHGCRFSCVSSWLQQSVRMCSLLACRRKSWEQSWSCNWQQSLKNVRLCWWTWNVLMIGSQRSTDRLHPSLRRSVILIFSTSRY